MAARKVRLLLKAKAEVTVIAPRLSPRVDDLKLEGRIKHVDRAFEQGDVIGYVLVIAATNREAANRLVADSSRRNGIPVNVVDHPGLCTFTIPSIVDRAPVTVAVSTGGTSPVLARLLRARLESLSAAA